MIPIANILLPLRPAAPRRRGLTLVELLISVAIVAVLSVAATNLIIAALRIDRVLIDSDRQVSEMELATRRMLHNLRDGSAISLTGTTGISLTSQTDSSNNGVTYSITYSYNAASQTITETSTQYGATPPANIIAYNVTAFSVTQVSLAPAVFKIDMTIGGATTSAPTRRVFQILNRNS